MEAPPGLAAELLPKLEMAERLWPSAVLDVVDRRIRVEQSHGFYTRMRARPYASRIDLLDERLERLVAEARRGSDGTEPYGTTAAIVFHEGYVFRGSRGTCERGLDNLRPSGRRQDERREAQPADQSSSSEGMGARPVIPSHFLAAAAFANRADSAIERVFK